MTHGYGGREPSAPYDGSDGWSEAGPADSEQGGTYPTSGYPPSRPSRHRRDAGPESGAVGEPIGYYPDAPNHYDPRYGNTYGSGHGGQRPNPYGGSSSYGGSDPLGNGATYPQATPPPREPYASGGGHATPPAGAPRSRQAYPGQPHQAYPGGPAQPGYPQPGYPQPGYPQHHGYAPQNYREPAYPDQRYPDHGYTEPGYSGERGFPPPTDFWPGGADDEAWRDGTRDPRAIAPGSTPTRRPGTGKTSGKPPKRRKSRSGAFIVWIIVIAIVAGGGYAGYRYYSERNSPTASSVVTTNVLPSLPAGDPIATQSTDSAPLTVAEVFGRSTIPSRAPGGSYSVVKSAVIDGCGGVGTGDIATDLGKLGCTQAVRADIMSPDQSYVITAGVINLPNTAAATSARSTIKSDIAAKSGTLSGYDAGGATSVITRAPTSAGWDARGHYVVYVVIAHADGQPIASSDDRVPLIVSDITENYLINTVIKARETAH